MVIDELWQVRQQRGYSMDMMAGLLGIGLEEYAELEFGLRLPGAEEKKILERLLEKEIYIANC